VLTQLKVSQDAALVVPRGPAQRYVVLDQHEWRLIAEASAEKSRDIVLALARGSYRVKRVLDDHIEVASLMVGSGDRVDVTRLAYQPAALSGGIVKGDPRDLEPVERRDWERTRAFGMLADGDANAALATFDRLLREAPDDTLAWRGRARALVRLADAYQRVNDRASERRTLQQALSADPSLSEDPMFQIWYQRLGEADARAWQTFELKKKFDLDVERNPRTLKRFGVGMDLFSGRGLFALTGTAVVHRMFFPTIAVDIAGAGLDIGLTIAPSASRWSPYIGAYGHVSAKRMGLDLGGNGTETIDEEGAMFTADEMWGVHARVEGGFQLVSTAGFTTELGLAMLVFQTDEGKTAQQLWPVIHLGWLWQ
jgi:tetratricopeptide (TPR) repeat protein